MENYRLTVVELGTVDYKDIPWVLRERVAQVFYVSDPEKQKKHVVISGKQRILGVDGVTDVEEYNQYDELDLFTGFQEKIKRVENNIDKFVKPWLHTDSPGKIVNG